MNKEQLITQSTYLNQQNQQAYLVYCQQIIYYLHALNWLRAIHMVNESTIW